MEPGLLRTARQNSDFGGDFIQLLLLQTGENEVQDGLWLIQAPAANDRDKTGMLTSSSINRMSALTKHETFSSYLRHK